MNDKTEFRRLLVFGATGRTGRLFVEMALKRGYAVTALVRNPSALAISHPNLDVVQGDVTQLAIVQELAKGKDALVSCLGGSGTGPTTVFSVSMKNMLAAMEQAGIKRIICLSAAGIAIDPQRPLWQRLAIKYILQRILRHPYEDTRRMEQLVRLSDTDWTIIRPPRLVNKPATGKYRFAVNEFLKRSASISRADLARFIADIIPDREMYKAIVEVAD